MLNACRPLVTSDENIGIAVQHVSSEQDADLSKRSKVGSLSTNQEYFSEMKESSAFSFDQSTIDEYHNDGFVSRNSEDAELCPQQDTDGQTSGSQATLAKKEEIIKALTQEVKFNAKLKKLYHAKQSVPLGTMNLLKDLESHIQNLENQLKDVKSENYRIQQTALDVESKQQNINKKYLSIIEALQMANYHLNQTHWSERQKGIFDFEKYMNLQEGYQALYSFTMKLVRKLHAVRKKLLEKHFAISNTSTELLQTQISLLLAHARFERQKIELEQSNKLHADVRRSLSYSGQDLLNRTVNPQLSFYLPFKLYGSRMVKTEADESDLTLYVNDDLLESEFMEFIESIKKMSGHEGESSGLKSQKRSPTAGRQSNSSIGDFRRSWISASGCQRENSGDRGVSLGVRNLEGLADIGERSSQSSLSSATYKEIQTSANQRRREPVPLSSVTRLSRQKNPSLIRLADAGHVRTMKATFEKPDLLTTTVKHFETPTSLVYGMRCQRDLRPGVKNLSLPRRHDIYYKPQNSFSTRGEEEEVDKGKSEDRRKTFLGLESEQITTKAVVAKDSSDDKSKCVGLREPDETKQTASCTPESSGSNIFSISFTSDDLIVDPQSTGSDMKPIGSQPLLSEPKMNSNLDTHENGHDPASHDVKNEADGQRDTSKTPESSNLPRLKPSLLCGKKEHREHSSTLLKAFNREHVTNVLKPVDPCHKRTSWLSKLRSRK
ncbi:unnamed protein product [Soboliphyme baturini]|uniref:Protein AKNAD1 n=1 Tax=Soboliphyme baturini TaxID=241478 RepID=A0A183II63_9BILA|nr:unnamed protein product [Soboliphyme baturini]